MKNTISRQCAEYKFDSQASAYFEHYKKFESLEQLEKKSSSMAEGTFCFLFGRLPKRLQLNNFFLCEALTYPCDNTFSLTAIKKKGSHIDLTFPMQTRLGMPKALSLSFICSADDIYTDLLQEAVRYYNKILKGKIEYEINVAYFGKLRNDSLKSCRLTTFPYDAFHMAYARKMGLQDCNHEIVMMLDVDCFLSFSHIRDLLNRLLTTPNHGVINIKQNYKSGNGLYLGEKDVLIENNYNEEFKDFWYEDTEYLMNFSRHGVIPCVEFINFEQKDHDRTKTIKSTRFQKYNRILFENIMKNGR